MKKRFCLSLIVALLVALALCVGLCGCKTSDTPGEPVNEYEAILQKTLAQDGIKMTYSLRSADEQYLAEAKPNISAYTLINGNLTEPILLVETEAVSSLSEETASIYATDGYCQLGGDLFWYDDHACRHFDFGDTAPSSPVETGDTPRETVIKHMVKLDWSGEWETDVQKTVDRGVTVYESKIVDHSVDQLADLTLLGAKGNERWKSLLSTSTFPEIEQFELRMEVEDGLLRSQSVRVRVKDRVTRCIYIDVTFDYQEIEVPPTVRDRYESHLHLRPFVEMGEADEELALVTEKGDTYLTNKQIGSVFAVDSRYLVRMTYLSESVRPYLTVYDADSLEPLYNMYLKNVPSVGTGWFMLNDHHVCVYVDDDASAGFEIYDLTTKELTAYVADLPFACGDDFVLTMAVDKRPYQALDYALDQADYADLVRVDLNGGDSRRLDRWDDPFCAPITYATYYNEEIDRVILCLRGLNSEAKGFSLSSGELVFTTGIYDAVNCRFVGDELVEGEYDRAILAQDGAYDLSPGAWLDTEDGRIVADFGNYRLLIKDGYLWRYDASSQQKDLLGAAGSADMRYLRVNDDVYFGVDSNQFVQYRSLSDQ